jgi:hypothetical protein
VIRRYFQGTVAHEVMVEVHRERRQDYQHCDPAAAVLKCQPAVEYRSRLIINIVEPCTILRIPLRLPYMYLPGVHFSLQSNLE